MRAIWLILISVVVGISRNAWAEGRPISATQALEGESVRDHLAGDLKKLAHGSLKADPSGGPSSRLRLMDELVSAGPEALPLLLEGVADRSSPKDYRLYCMFVLSDPALSPYLTEYGFRQLSEIAVDTSEDTDLRLEAGSEVAVYQRAIPQRFRGSLKRLGLDCLNDAKADPAKTHLLLARFKGDSEVESVLLDRIRKASPIDKNGLVDTLGKVGGKKAIPVIVGILNSRDTGRGFYRTRGIYALGDIGGEEAFQALTKLLSAAQGWLERGQILESIGRTKAIGARDLLLGWLHKNNDECYASVLMGFKVLGDPSVLPLLRGELRRPCDATRRYWLERTIRAIEARDEGTVW
ncbi:MAG: HEAT repeat domain-containing protein [Candidatus Coatesbacteria bacterium]|mgnify:CR=1 FL=1